MRTLTFTLASIVLGILILVRCGSSDSSSSANPNAGSMASMAVVNPTAATSGTASVFSKTKDVLWSAMNFSGLQYVLTKLGVFTPKKSMAADSSFTGCTNASDKLADVCADPDALIAEMETLKNDSSTAAAAAELANFTDITNYRAGCYGPALTEDSTGSSVNRPSGDLGLWASSLSATDTTACAAGQLTALLGGYPSFANDVLALQAAFVTGLKLAGKSLPAVGETVDGKDNLPSITGFTVATATISRYSDTSGGKKVYYTTFTGTNTAGKAFSAHIYHQPDDESNTTFKGTIKAIFPHTATQGGSGDKSGLSMIYNKTADAYIYRLKVASNRATSSSDFFAANGEVDFSKSAFGEDGHVIIASFNNTTNAGTMHYAWQAGSSDGAVRAFAINVPAGTEGSLTGVAYFGFGAAITSIADSPGGSSIWATKMYCNWLNGLSGGTSQSVIQKQSLIQDATTGKFLNSGTARISFAPTNTCVKAGSWTVSGATPSTYNTSRSAVASSDSDYLTSYTANDVPAVTVTAPDWGSTLPTN